METWGYKPILIRVITPLITGRGPPCMGKSCPFLSLSLFFSGCQDFPPGATDATFRSCDVAFVERKGKESTVEYYISSGKIFYIDYSHVFFCVYMDDV